MDVKAIIGFILIFSFLMMMVALIWGAFIVNGVFGIFILGACLFIFGFFAAQLT